MKSGATDVLTARELQIAVLITQGFKSKAIGSRLNIAAATVDAHRARIYSKLRVRKLSTLAASIVGTVALHRRAATTTLSATPAHLSDQASPPL